jgi:hypothetical protein
MRLRAVLIVIVLLLPGLALAQSKKKKTTPAMFANAHYVWVKAEDGDIYTPGLLPEDRQAIMDVDDALRSWNRYVLTPSQEGAELVFIVRKGRVASARIGGTVGTANPQRPGSYPRQPQTGAPGAMAGAELGPPDDLLEVRMRQPDGTLSGPIWIRSQTDGLNAPNVALVRMLRDAVEKDYPR